MTRRRVWLGVIVATALLVRLFALVSAAQLPEPWLDPDGYLIQARLLLRDGWQFEAFMYDRVVKAPLYPLFLAAVGLISDRIEPWAAVVQILLGAGAVAALYVIGRDMHSHRAGLLAAVMYALWLPAIVGTHIFLQEQLHVPLVVVGFALLVRASARSAGLWQFLCAGAVLGLAALARSMPLYYIAPAALVYVGVLKGRPAALRQAGGLLLGLLLVVVPWCVVASAHTGQMVLIDNMGSAALGVAYKKEIRPNLHGFPPATVFESIGMLWRAVTHDPARFFGDRVQDSRRLFRLVGGQWLLLHRPVGTRTQATALKAVAHAGDLLLVISALLAPFGAVLARRRLAAALVALWVALHIGLLIAFAWNGVRYRAPYEPLMIALGSVVLAGGWVAPRRTVLALAALVSISMGAALAPSFPETIARRAAYGFDGWNTDGGTPRAAFHGEGGFNLLNQTGVVDLGVIVADSALAGGPVRARVRLGGRPADEILMEGTERRLRYAWTLPIAFVELAVTSADRRPVAFSVEADRPVR